MALEIVQFRPESAAERAGLTALLDLGDLLADAPISVGDTRVIGGHMVGIHVVRAGLDRSHVRMTADTDFGLDVRDLRGLDLVERFAKRDYKLRGGHRFLFCKVLAWEDRRRKTADSKDTFDIWRCLEICHKQGVKPDSWPESFDDAWKGLLRSNFGQRDAEGSRALAQYLRSNGLDPVTRVTRTMALVKSIVG